MESEINIEPFVRAERLPSSLPWAVYRADDSRSGRRVRLAVLWAPDNLPAERARAALDWFSEAGYQAQRLSSEAIPTVVSYRSGTEAAHVATDLPAGAPVRDWLEANGPLPVARAMRISSRVADALAQVHAVGWAHGWLNAETVWLAEDGSVSMVDLGLGLAVQSVAPGRPFPYVAEEGFLSPDPLRRDLQCLGLLLTQMLTGRLPDPVGVPRGDIFPEEVPGGVVQRIKNLVNPRADRPLSAAQWADFARVGDEPAADVEVESPADRYYESPVSGAWWRLGAAGKGWLWGAALALILAVVVVAGYALLPRRGAGTRVPATDAPTSSATRVAPEVLIRMQTGPVEPGQEEAVSARLRGLGFDPYIVRDGGAVYFQVGAFANPEGAQATRDQLTAAGLPVREVR